MRVRNRPSLLQPVIRFWFGLLLAGSAASAVAAPPDAMAQRVAPCMSCHSDTDRVTGDGYYPRIAGKPPGYLYNQLINFRDGRRQQYPLMVYMVQHLSDDYLREIAEYFAAQKPPYPPPQRVDVSQATLERGRVLATVGDGSKNIPACSACHGEKLTGVAPSIPGLLGLPRDYINAQFGAWRDGRRHAAAPDCMAQLAQRLSVEDISAASAWLAMQPVPADASPTPPASIRLPMPCGSFAGEQAAR